MTKKCWRRNGKNKQKQCDVSTHTRWDTICSEHDGVDPSPHHEDTRMWSIGEINGGIIYTVSSTRWVATMKPKKESPRHQNRWRGDYSPSRFLGPVAMSWSKLVGSWSDENPDDECLGRGHTLSKTFNANYSCTSPLRGDIEPWRQIDGEYRSDFKVYEISGVNPERI